MSDFTFEATFVPRTATAKVERMSMLWPVIRRAAGDDSAVKDDFFGVLALWRLCLEQLRKIGWEHIKDFRRLNLMRNCHPSCVATRVQDFPLTIPQRCDMDYFCPWCWARRAARAYTDFCEVLPATRPHGSAVLLRRSELLAASSGLNRHLTAVLYYGDNEIAKLADKLGGSATLRLSCVEPVVRHDRRFWRFSHRVLVSYPPDTSLPDLTNLDPKLRPGYAVGVTRRVLRKMVSHLFRYPTGLLRGPTAMSATALRARKGLRLCVSTGGIRNTKPRQRKK